MPKILVSDKLGEEGVSLLRNHGEVDVKTGLPPEELLSIIGNYDALVVRSETKVSSDVIEAGVKLQVIGRAGVGVDNIDLQAATHKGIAVVNAPTGNTIAAAEHTVAMMMALARNIPQANESLHKGEWTRSAFTGIELRNRVLGVIGLGKVGIEVARRAIGLDMQVTGYDPFVPEEYASSIGIQLKSLDDIYKDSDFICLHTPLTESTRGLIGEKQIAMMKPTVRILNVARGELIDEQALAEAVDKGQVAGAALDVFTKEPPVDSPLLNNPKIITTPHLGASTEEAQAQVAIEVAEQVITVLSGKSARYTLNAPLVLPEGQATLSPYISPAIYAGKIATQLTKGQLKKINIRYEGEIANHDTNILKAACLVGFLDQISQERVNLVNANLLASQRGLNITEQKATQIEQYSSLITVEVESSEGKTIVSTSHIRDETHIVRVNDYWIDLVATSGYMLFTDHHDRPGMIGSLGTITGKHDINIAFMEVGRLEPRGRATMIVGLDDPMPQEALTEINDLPDVISTSVVQI
ncbi:MAG: phosphoglycerate dehydrogenase [SAR202 cluster bacterium]|nr:phosphoglycerate dehydrogenase [SAR202 cluster bacterium]